MKKIILTSLALGFSFPFFAKGETVLTNAQVEGWLQIGTGYNYIMASDYNAFSLGYDNTFIGDNQWSYILGCSSSSNANIGTTITASSSHATRASYSFVAGYSNSVTDVAHSSVVGIYNNSDSTTFTHIFGWSNTTDNSSNSTVSIGGYNQIASSDYTNLLGQFNSATECTSSVILGTNNNLGGSDSVQSGSFLYEIGGGLSLPINVSSISPQRMMLLGFYNAAVPMGTTGSDPTSALLVVGNGTSAARSNALVILKNGRTTLTHGEYSAPSVTVPVSPKETLVVQGDSRLSGTVRIPPAGDLEMGSFTGSPVP